MVYDKQIVASSIYDEIAELYVTFFKAIFGYCAYRLFGKKLAEDATSSVFLRLAEEYPRLRGRSKTEIRNWLYGTASNVVARYLRDAQRQKAVLAELARERKNVLTRPFEDREKLDWSELYEAIRKLKPRDQEVIALRYFQGFETSIIAEVTGMSHVAVRVRLSRAVKKLRQELKKSFVELYRTT
ncbi:MAG: sigma-70 family RNA polymerase sigma factor [Planctomycetota bacterium]|nr:sigma-70 family RNA polymerase sigma factor [Planctomycetota bacterium]